MSRMLIYANYVLTLTLGMIPDAMAGRFNDNDQFQLSGVTLESQTIIGDETELTFSGQLLNVTSATWNSAAVVFDLPSGATHVLPFLFETLGPGASISNRDPLTVRAPSALATLLASQIVNLSLGYTIDGSETPVYISPVEEYDEETDDEFTTCAAGSNPDELTCTFANSTDLLMDLDPGDFLIVGDYKQTPDYILDTAPAVPSMLPNLPAEVLSAVGGGPVTVTVRRIQDISEIVETASYEDAVEIDAYSHTVSPDDYDIQVAGCNPAEAVVTRPCHLPSIPIRFNEIEVDAGLFVSGELRLTLFKPNGRIRIRPGDESSLSLGFESGYVATVTAEARADVDLGSVDINLATISMPVTTLNLGVPIYVTAELQFLAGATGQLTAGTTVTTHSEGNAYLGFTWSSLNGLTTDSEFSGVPLKVTEPELSDALSASARIWAGLDASLRLSLDPGNVVGSLGPTYRFNIGAGLEVTPLSDDLWTLNYDARHQGKFEVHLPAWEISPIESQESIEPIGSTSGKSVARVPTTKSHLDPSTPVASGGLVRWARVLSDSRFNVSIDPPILRQLPLVSGQMLYYGFVAAGDGFVGKVSRRGIPRWERELDLGAAPVGAVQMGAGEILLAGNRGDDIWLMLLDSAGQMLAFEAYDTDPVCTLSGMARGSGASVDSIVLAGKITIGTVSQSDVCLVGVDLDRNILWASSYESYGDDEADELIALKDGAFAFAGVGDVETTDPFGHRGGLMGVADKDGNIQWMKVARSLRTGNAFNALVETPAGELVAAGTILRTVSDHIPALWVAKFAADGSEVDHYLYEQDFEWEDELSPWTPTAGGATAYDEAFDITAADGGLIVAGKTGLSGTDIAGWLMRLKPDMAVDWHVTYDGDGSELLYDVKESQGGLQVLGSTTSHLPNGDRGLLMMRVPYEGLMRFADDTATVTRYLQPRAVRSTQNALFDTDTGTLLMADWIRRDVIVTPSTDSSNANVDALPYFSTFDELALTNRHQDFVFSESFE